MELLGWQGLFGDEQKCVQLTMFQDGGAIEIFVDKYREGSINFYSTGMAVHMHPMTSLTGDDIYILLELIKSNNRLRNAILGNRLLERICQAIK